MYVITAMFSTGDHRVVKVLDNVTERGVEDFIREHLARAVRNWPAYGGPPPVAYKSTAIDHTGEPAFTGPYIHYVNQGMIGQVAGCEFSRSQRQHP